MTDEELIAKLRARRMSWVGAGMDPDPDCHPAADRIEALAAHAEAMAQIVEAYRERAERLEEALLWCSGTAADRMEALERKVARLEGALRDVQRYGVITHTPPSPF